MSLRLGPSPHWAVTTLLRRRSARLKTKEGRAWNAAEFLRISSGLLARDFLLDDWTNANTSAPRQERWAA